MQGWNTLVVRPSIGEDGELSEPEAPAGARFPLPALPARAELRDAEVHAMLGELDFGESAVMGIRSQNAPKAGCGLFHTLNQTT